jgi:enamine deaminase RidA (YjgF/YER057c/UK114 family)
MERVSSGSSYEPVIGFSRAVKVGRTIAVSGTAPIGTDGKTVGSGDPAAQTRRCLEIIIAAIEQLGGSARDVIRTRTYITRVEDWEQIGRAHGEFFADIRPASTMVKVGGLLDPDWLVEIEADAVLPGGAQP